MKKIAGIFLFAFYLFASMGIMVNVHYCGGKVKEIALMTDFSACCDDEDQCSGGCCDDETVVIQIDNEDQLLQDVSEWKLMHLDLAVAPVPDFEMNPEIVKDQIAYEFTDLPPPRNQSLRLLNCSLTYYG